MRLLQKYIPHLTFYYSTSYNKFNNNNYHFIDVNKIVILQHKGPTTMLNIYFAFFLFGLMSAICIKGLYRAIRYGQTFTSKEYALLTALFIGIIASVYMGMSKLGF